MSGWAEFCRPKIVPFAMRWARYAMEWRRHRVQQGEYCTDRARLHSRSTVMVSISKISLLLGLDVSGPSVLSGMSALVTERLLEGMPPRSAFVR